MDLFPSSGDREKPAKLGVTERGILNYWTTFICLLPLYFLLELGFVSCRKENTNMIKNCGNSHEGLKLQLFIVICIILFFSEW